MPSEVWIYVWNSNPKLPRPQLNFWLFEFLLQTRRSLQWPTGSFWSLYVTKRLRRCKSCHVTVEDSSRSLVKVRVWVISKSFLKWYKSITRIQSLLPWFKPRSFNNPKDNSTTQPKAQLNKLIIQHVLLLHRCLFKL